jgi:cell division protein FtsI (penicillin-binding protein 3)
VLDPVIANQVLHMMQTVTEPGGTATQAAILGYHVAGKTGTARKASAGGYSRRYIGYFAGLVPVEKPRFAMVVACERSHQGRSYYGGMVSGPGVPQRDGRRVADDGRVAGQPGCLAGRAGRG